MFEFPPMSELPRRVPPLLLGLIAFGVGIAMMVQANLGLPSWDVLHQGLFRRIGGTIGTYNVAVGVVLLVCFWPLKEKIGLGTVLNVMLIGPVVDLFISVVDEPGSLAVRWVFMLTGPLIVGFGSGLYIGSGLGPGPRDGLMTGLAKRGTAIWKVRTVIEIAVLVVGFTIGGTAGAGTIWFAISIGPFVQFFLKRLTFLPALGATAAADATRQR